MVQPASAAVLRLKIAGPSGGYVDTDNHCQCGARALKRRIPVSEAIDKDPRKCAVARGPCCATHDQDKFQPSETTSPSWPIEN
jgi:hypothetical protein